MFKKIILSLITAYQQLKNLISPQSPCRFDPTCSQYAKEAIIKHGILKGIVLGTKRIARCHPYNPGGFDPVP